MIDSTLAWKITITLATGIYTLRALFIIPLLKAPIPEQLKIFIDIIPVVVLPALAAPLIAEYSDTALILPSAAKLCAIAFAISIACWSNKSLPTILAGLGSFYLLNWIL